MNKQAIADRIAGGVFDITTADEWAQRIQNSINAPVVGVKKSTLGGPARVSLWITVSLDKREDWVNGIPENSRYFRLHLQNDGVLEMFSGGWRSARPFRKTRVLSADDVVAKINRYIAEVGNVAIASELVMVAESLVAEDTAEDIAADVSSRMDAGMGIADAFRDIGHAELWRNTREADMPRNWEHQPSSIRLRILTKAVERAMGKTASSKVSYGGAVMGKALIDVPLRMRMLPHGELLPEYQVSYDGRYFGWQQVGAILGCWLLR